ncbi:hypothetical protein LENED_009353 [Lentinula edodes]|uniref:F-box domain-containing protein n=1 Tax=Lentinula edodes TaxID=5353 RepID=A0A1Q3EJL6_LENED|nr:hypothetical protein LENED_009353 [Lentinula edodes]
MWSSLPTEMKLAVVEVLDSDDVKSLSQVDRDTYIACLPSSFKNVKLNNLQALQTFVDNVPRSYCRYVHYLDLCTESNARTLALRNSSCAQEAHSIIVSSPALDILASWNVFPFTTVVQKTSSLCMLSERLVVAIAASVPDLKRLSLDRVSRSLMHAPELHGVPPYIPLVSGDENIPDHPRLGADLYLPSLLQLPTLRELVIRDTHLGDRRWATVPVKCKLQVVDLGSCFHENEDFNSICIQRIMGAVGKTVDEFSLTTTVSDIVFAKPSVTPLQRLRKLHISPFFPVDSVVDTITNLAGSPIENLSMQCYEDDVVDVCVALEEFLNRRVERGVGFYEKLARIDVSVTSNDALSPLGPDEVAECKEAEQRLKELCRDLRLASRFSRTIPPSAASRLARSSGLVMTRLPAPGDGRVRSMTL